MAVLCFDEIESMPIAVQIKLLRVIQEERMIERVGGKWVNPGRYQMWW